MPVIFMCHIIIDYAVLVVTLIAKTKSWEEERNKTFLYDDVS